MLMASAGRECTHIRSCQPRYYGGILILCSHLQIWMSHENPSIFWRQTNFYQTQYHVTLSLTNWCCWNLNNMTLNDHDTRNDSLIFCWCIWLMLEQSLCFIIFKGMIIFCCKLVIIIWSWQLWIVLTKFLLFQHNCLAIHKKSFWCNTPNKYSPLWCLQKVCGVEQIEFLHPRQILRAHLTRKIM